MKEVKMMMAFDDSNEGPAELTGNFTDEDLALLKQYCEHAELLRKTRIIRDEMPSKLTFTWNEDGTSIETNSDLDFESIGAFLHYMRPLFLEEEPASFKKTAALIGRCFSHKAMKRHLKAIRSKLENSEFSSYGQITIGDVPVFDNETLRKWLYGFHYHQDPDKKEYLKNVRESFSEEGTRYIFIQQLTQQAEGYFHLEKLARFIIDFE